MKKLLILMLLLITGLHGFSQSVSPKVLASSGSYQSTSGYSLSFTFGQPLNVTTFSNAGYELTQGFQQPSGQVGNSCNLLYGKTVSNATCYGVCDGEAMVSVFSGNSPYTYLWSDGQTNSTATGLCPGMYYITITDSTGCPVTDSINITEPSLLTASITGTDVSACGGSNGAANLTVSGGTQSYTFNWLSGETTEDLTGLSAGNYSVTVTDSNGCTANTNVLITEPQAITTNITGTDVTTCGGSDGAADLTVTGGVSPYTFIWSNGANTEDISSLSPGTYSVTVIDSNGCTVSDAVTISSFAAISISFTTTDALCNGQCDGSATVTASGGTAPYTYLWSDGQTDSTAAGLCAGTYNITVTDANMCEANSSVNVPEPAPVILTMTTVDATCGNSDGIAMVSVSGGTPPYDYSWSSGDTTETDSALAAGINYVIVTDDNNCIAYGVAAISNTTPTITVSSIVDLNCSADADGSIDIGVSGGVIPYTFLWSNGDTIEDISGLIGGIYEVTVTDATGCIATQSITVTAPDPLILSMTEVDASCNSSDGSATVNVSGGTAPYTYFWSTFGTDSSQSGLAAGIYVVNVFDANGCFNSITAEISNAGGPVITLNSQTNPSCGNPSGGAIDINVAGGALPYTYQWSNGFTTQDINNLTDTSYNITVTDTNGCIGTASYIISGALPSIQPICIITVDSATGKNLIVWEKSPGPSSYNIYKEGTAAGVYFLLASVPYNSLSQYLDLTANPMQRSWRYKISAVDSCGNESELSPLHKTMHLTSNLGINGEINLIWDHYEGFSLSTYIIYRQKLPFASDSINAIPSNLNSYSDPNPPNGQLLYHVAAIHPSGCTASKKAVDYNSSRSNTATSESPSSIYQYTIINNQLKVYPNPNTGEFVIEMAITKLQDMQLRIFNILGQSIYAESLNNIIGNYKKVVDLKSIPTGIYNIQLLTDKLIINKKIIIE